MQTRSITKLLKRQFTTQDNVDYSKDESADFSCLKVKLIYAEVYKTVDAVL